MLTGWRPIEISADGPFAPGAGLTMTVVLQNVVTATGGLEVIISTNHPEAFDLLPESVIVPLGSSQASFDVGLKEGELPASLMITVTCDGGSLSFPPDVNGLG